VAACLIKATVVRSRIEIDWGSGGCQVAALWFSALEKICMTNASAKGGLKYCTYLYGYHHLFYAPLVSRG
jgi:hypothetical protein